MREGGRAHDDISATTTTTCTWRMLCKLPVASCLLPHPLTCSMTVQNVQLRAPSASLHPVTGRGASGLECQQTAGNQDRRTTPCPAQPASHALALDPYTSYIDQLVRNRSSLVRCQQPARLTYSVALARCPCQHTATHSTAPGTDAAHLGTVLVAVHNLGHRVAPVCNLLRLSLWPGNSTQQTPLRPITSHLGKREALHCK